MLMSVMRPLVALLIVFTLASPAVAAQSLRDHETVNNGLLIVAIGNAIRKTCPTIEPRRVRALSYMRGLYNIARGAGFSDDQIKAYVENDAEKDRVKALADRWLVQQGATPGDAASVCAVGMAEIEKNSQLGRLLYVKG
jgi:hypothetical protein